MAFSFQKKSNIVTDKYNITDVINPRGRIMLKDLEEASWVAERLQDRVSYTGWFLAMMAGLWLWTVLIRLVV